MTLYTDRLLWAKYINRKSRIALREGSLSSLASALTHSVSYSLLRLRELLRASVYLYSTL